MKKLLVANRGEIALRIMKTAKKMGMITIAVFSDVDRNAPFVLFADEAYLLGEATPSESYLNIDKIINIALKAKANFIHPGYGFLSENALFSQKVTDNNIQFIGPKPHSIKIMGSKLAAKEAVKSFDTPLIEGTDTPIKNNEEALKIAKKIGFPVMVKASAGGGGKGMRIVEHENDFIDQLNRAQSEALSSFGDDAVFIEKFVKNPKHIEIQVLADTHGNVVHLGERDCSVQRRHQKVVEEAPSIALSNELRAIMGEVACNVARACDYEGTGTVEFLLDEYQNFYFLEMNTRLQVEHPVTELVTGIDLVEQQILVAEGQALSFSQNEIKLSGHAIELRVYAEDTINNFMPNIGKLEIYKSPISKNIRVDDGYREGMEIPLAYDSMISKLIAFGENRNEAIKNLSSAIKAYQIKGVETTLPFGDYVINHENFISGKFTTNFVEEFYEDYLKTEKEITDEEKIVAMLINHLKHEENNKNLCINKESSTNWKKNRI